jgi:hypothetical protein
MALRIIRLIFVASVCLAASAFPALAADTWMASNAEGKSIIMYGVVDSPEEITLVLSCEGGGGVEIFVARGSDKLTPGQSVDFTMSVGAVKSTFKGAAYQNLLDGIPSVKAIGGLNEQVFKALKGRGTLVIDIAGEKTNVALQSLGSKGSKFLAACKPI